MKITWWQVNIFKAIHMMLNEVKEPSHHLNNFLNEGSGL